MNPFDSLAGYDDNNLGSLKKKLKKGLKKVDSARRKVLKKTLPKPLYKAQSKVGAAIKKNPLVAGAVAVAASVVLSPVAGAAVKAAAGKAMAAAKAIKIAKVAKTASTGLKVAGAVKKRKADKKIKQQAKKAQQAEAVAQEAVEIQQDIKQNNPDFSRMVQTMQAQGKSPVEIRNTFAKSRAFVDTTKQAVKAKYKPAIVQQLMSQGASPEQAEVVAEERVEQLGEQAAQEIQQKTGASFPMPLLLGGGLLLSLLL